MNKYRTFSTTFSLACGLLLASPSTLAGPDWAAMRKELLDLKAKQNWIGLNGLFKGIKAAAEEGNLIARVALCEGYGDEDSPFYDNQAAREIAGAVLPELQKLADGGDPEACYHMYGIHQWGLGVEKDETKAMGLLRRAADAGLARAQAALGRCYLRGLGVPEDLDQANAYLSKALESDDPEIAYEVGSAYAGPLFYRIKDKERGLRAYTLAAERGHAFSAYTLDQFYREGVHTPQDITKADYWRLKAGELGYSVSASDLADEALEREDFQAAVKWLKVAADEGCIPSCEKLAEMYETGQGVRVSPIMASDWRTKAAQLRLIDERDKLIEVNAELRRAAAKEENPPGRTVPGKEAEGKSDPGMPGDKPAARGGLPVMPD